VHFPLLLPKALKKIRIEETRIDEKMIEEK
jgi:hypothetical protein